jgi:hypothetical protein
MTDPTATPLRIAYFLSSYGSGEQLLRLVRTIRRAEPDAPIVVHHDDHGSQPLDRALFAGLDVTVFGGIEPIVWGDMSLEAARWRIFRWISSALDVDWVMLLSEQDYPIAPFERLRERLASSGADAILDATPVDAIVDERERRQMQDRYYYSYVVLPDLGLARLPAPLDAVAAQAKRLLFGALRRSHVLNAYRGQPANGMPDRIGVRRKQRHFPEAFPAWANESWFAISMRGVRAVLDHVDANPALVQHYRRTVIPVESATATILCNHPELRIDTVPLHAIRWTERNTGRPDVLTIEDLPFLDASAAFFTRKIGPDDVALRDALDARVDLSQPA